MNLEQAIKMILSDPNDINVEYTNINGIEKLIVNGNIITEDPIYNRVEKFRKDIDKMDDDLFIEIAEQFTFKSDLDYYINNINELNKDQLNDLNILLNNFYELTKSIIENKIEYLCNLIKEL